MKVLIAVLTSKDADALHNCLLSIDNGRKVPLCDVEISKVVICNTTDKSYYRFANGCCTARQWPLIITESNGTPGKGKNSVIDYFLNQTDCDYLIHIDGDDSLSQNAISDLVDFIVDRGSDVVGLANQHIFIDGKKINPDQLDSTHLSVFEKSTSNWNEETWQYFGEVSGLSRSAFGLVDRPLWKDWIRTIAFSRKGAQQTVFDEYLLGTEDVLLSLELKTKAKQGTLTFDIIDCENTPLYYYHVDYLNQGAFSAFSNSDKICEQYKYVLEKVERLDLDNFTLNKYKI